MSDVEASLLPPNASALERSLTLAMSRPDRMAVPVRDVWNADRCPVALLPWLAWAYSVDQWDDDWNAEQKRAVIKRSISVHRRKGTIGAVQDALRAIGLGIRVQEWFNQAPAGDPYTFRILLTTDQIGISRDMMRQAVQVVEDTKNLRSHLESLQPSISTGSILVSGGTSLSGVHCSVECGIKDLSLLMEAVALGTNAVSASVDTLHEIVHTTIPQSWGAA